ncbi:protein of unknown function [Cyanobium sp. NIES-981]|nr:protein of unknown function [Cyanobium sp. NIES-981]
MIRALMEEKPGSPTLAEATTRDLDTDLTTRSDTRGRADTRPAVDTPLLRTREKSNVAISQPRQKCWQQG